jgi:hypothetical protein
MRYDWIVWLMLLVGSIAFLATSALGADFACARGSDPSASIQDRSQAVADNPTSAIGVLSAVAIV